MRVSELSSRSGVPVSSIKFYIREGLLGSGERQARNQASYGEEHLERLALIRTLQEVADLPLEAIGRVLEQLDRGWEGGDPVGEALRSARTGQQRAAESLEDEALARAQAEVRDFLSELTWTTDPHGTLDVEDLARALLQVRRYLFPDYPVTALLPYADVAWLLSEVEYATAPGGARVPLREPRDDLTDPVRRAILGTLLFERIFGALRRTANTMRSVRISDGLPVPEARAPRLPGENQG